MLHWLLPLGMLLWFGYSYMSRGWATHWIGIIGCLIGFLGAAMNAVAVVLNKGKMPVRTNEVPNCKIHPHSHTLMHQKTRLRFLCDWIDLGRIILSPGDVCLYIGLIIMLTQILRR